MITRHYTVMAEVNASDLFQEGNDNEQFCVDHASFIHREEDGQEYILHAGDDGDGEPVKDMVAAMAEYGCTPEFIEAYRLSAEEGALRVLFYV